MTKRVVRISTHLPPLITPSQRLKHLPPSVQSLRRQEAIPRNRSADIQDELKQVIEQFYCIKLGESFNAFLSFVKEQGGIEGLESIGLRACGPLKAYLNDVTKQGIEKNAKTWFKDGREDADPFEFVPFLAFTEENSRFGYWRDSPNAESIFIGLAREVLAPLILPCCVEELATLSTYLSSLVAATKSKPTKTKRELVGVACVFERVT